MFSNWPAGVGRRILPTTDSTMAEAQRIAPGLAAPEWILALEQTAGRGRRGRDWVAPAGNFSATLVMQPTEPPEKIAMRSFVAALALYDAFADATGKADGLSLKWPNDVLLNGGKVAGILLESGQAPGQRRYLAIGIGVNLVAAPPRAAVDPGAVTPVSLADETGAVLDPEAFLELLAPAFATWEGRFVTYGFAPIRDAWLARAARLGETITARVGQTSHEGRFDTVDADGQLVLVTAKGRMHIPAADIFF